MSLSHLMCLQNLRCDPMHNACPACDTAPFTCVNWGLQVMQQHMQREAIHDGDRLLESREKAGRARLQARTHPASLHLLSNFITVAVSF